MTASARDDAAGVYAAPCDVSPLRARFCGPLDLWRSAELGAVSDKEGLLDAVTHTLDFPAHFGSNWDALADSLQDLAWLRWSCLVLELRSAGRVSASAPEDWKVALDILRDAATYWAARGKRFVVLVDGAAGLPAWRA